MSFSPSTFDISWSRRLIFLWQVIGTGRPNELVFTTFARRTFCCTQLIGRILLLLQSSQGCQHLKVRKGINSQMVCHELRYFEGDFNPIIQFIYFFDSSAGIHNRKRLYLDRKLDERPTIIRTWTIVLRGTSPIKTKYFDSALVPLSCVSSKFIIEPTIKDVTADKLSARMVTPFFIVFIIHFNTPCITQSLIWKTGQ